MNKINLMDVEGTYKALATYALDFCRAAEYAAKASCPADLDVKGNEESDINHQINILFDEMMCLAEDVASIAGASGDEIGEWYESIIERS